MAEIQQEQPQELFSYEKIENTLLDIDEAIKTLKTSKTALKSVIKRVKVMELKFKKTKKTNKSKSPSGFLVPVKISQELCKFLKEELYEVLNSPIEIPENASQKVVGDLEKKKEDVLVLKEKLDKLSLDDCMFARSDVTKLLPKYAIYHKLQHPEAKTKIKTSGTPKADLLGKILSPIVDKEGKETDLTFINIQRYINHHFPKKDANKEKPKEENPEESLDTPPTEETVTKKKKVRKVVKKKKAVKA